mmetsp:Transcript_88740/g.255912  ORF Transcript_88740/g.255912 Transcript_88740/m.255912 type:complete len:229 (-) Transcript_88740:34-720(-)
MSAPLLKGVVVVRNTFLEVPLEDEGADVFGRRRSLPAPGRDARASRALAPLIAAWADGPARAVAGRAAEAGDSEEGFPTRGDIVGLSCGSLSQSCSSRGKEDASTPRAASSAAFRSDGEDHPASQPSACPARLAGACWRGEAGEDRDVARQQQAVTRGRPSKTKRQRIKRAMASLQKEVEEHPELWSRGEVRIPAVADINPRARARMMAQLGQVAADAIDHRCGAAAQ